MCPQCRPWIMHNSTKLSSSRFAWIFVLAILFNLGGWKCSLLSDWKQQQFGKLAKSVIDQLSPLLIQLDLDESKVPPGLQFFWKCFSLWFSHGSILHRTPLKSGWKEKKNSCIFCFYLVGIYESNLGTTINNLSFAESNQPAPSIFKETGAGITRDQSIEPQALDCRNRWKTPKKNSSSNLWIGRSLENPNWSYIYI